MNTRLLTTAELAAAHGLSLLECNEQLIAAGLQHADNGRFVITEQGLAAGGQLQQGSLGYYQPVWPHDLTWP